MSATELTAEQAAALAAVVSGRTPAPAADSTFERVWHPAAITIGVLGVVGGVIMIRRAVIYKVNQVETALDNVHWWNPFSWPKIF